MQRIWRRWSKWCRRDEAADTEETISRMGETLSRGFRRERL